MGLEVASTSLVGRYVGARDGAAASRSTYSGLKLGWGYSLLMGVFFIFLPGILTDIFKPDAAEASAEALAIFAAARPMSIFMLRIATFYIFVEVLLVIYAGALRGAGDTVVYSTAPLIFWLRWKSGKWRKHVMDKDRLAA